MFALRKKFFSTSSTTNSNTMKNLQMKREFIIFIAKIITNLFRPTSLDGQ